MTNKAERKILDMVELGQISAEEGVRLMSAMESRGMDSPSQGLIQHDAAETIFVSADDVEEPAQPRISDDELGRMKRLKRWWVLPFGIGLLITTLGTIWMYSGYMAKGFGWGFWLAWIPFLIGILVVAFSFRTSRSVWLHVRIKQKPGESPQRISFSLPMPISFTRWFFSAFGSRIPGLKDQPIGDYTEILENLSPEEPFYVHVHDDDGEEVEVFIG